MFSHQLTWQLSSSFLACHSYDCVAPYVDIILHSGWFWAKSAASGSVRWCCFRSCWTVLSHVMWRRPSCLLQSAIGEADRILLASALLSMRIICPNRVSRRDWIIAVSLGCFVSLRSSSFRTNWYHLMSSSIICADEQNYCVKCRTALTRNSTCSSSSFVLIVEYSFSNLLTPHTSLLLRALNVGSVAQW